MASNDIGNNQKNLFINCYIMKFVWKHYHKPINELYEILGVNRSFFDRVYRLEPISKLDQVAREMSDKTGLGKGFFMGKEYIEIQGLYTPTWDKFINSTIKRRKQPEDGIILEDQAQIGSYLNQAINNPSKQPYSFNTINYFLKNGQKKRDDTVENIVSEIEAGIKELTLGQIQKLPPELFDRHKAIILDYAQKLYSLGVIEAWKDASK